LLMKDELELRRMIIDTFDFISASMLSEWRNTILK
jgi:hypothetical protein